jgi:hypothetical protein
MNPVEEEVLKMGRPVQYFGGFNILLRIWRFKHLSPGSNQDRRLRNTIFRLFINLAPFLGFFITMAISITKDEPVKFALKSAVPMLLLILNMSNFASLNARFDQLDALINLVPIVSTKRVRAQLTW